MNSNRLVLRFWTFLLCASIATPAFGNPAGGPHRTVDPLAATRGFDFLTHKPYLEGQLNGWIFDNLWRAWEPELKKAARHASKKVRREMTLDRYGFMEAPYDNDGAPMGFLNARWGLWTNNCLMCHGGQVLGKPMVGAPNVFIDLQTFNEDAKRLSHQKMGTEWLNHSAGTTNAFGFAVSGIAARDKNLDPIQTALEFPGNEGSDLDPPAWWNLKWKRRLYIDGFAPVGPRALMQFVLVNKKDGTTIRSWEPDFADLLQFIDGIQAPRFPGQVDSIRVARGRAVFAKTCAGCHGDAGSGESYPERAVPLELVGTDPQRALSGLTPRFREYYRDGWLCDYGRDEIHVDPLAYVAPPLQGIWASAPYFHNGSVPTLWHVLHPSARPAIWKIKDRKAYDSKRMGLMVEEFATFPAGVRYGFERRRYFDSTLKSKGNEGHRFADRLSEPEKEDVLEYLKTL
jgi:mono/diheme cytochrome c family protein